MTKILFHLAFPVKDIASTKAFYIDGLAHKRKPRTLSVYKDE
jgi:extradiol dioxygenase family protein